MKKVFTILLIILSFSASAQINEFVKYNGNNDSLRIINKQILDSILKTSKAKIKWLIIYTNYCGGTKYVLGNVNRYRSKYGDKLEIILASSAPYKEISALRKVLNKFSVMLPLTYIIDGDHYKDYKSDDRKKGYHFRRDVCNECKHDIIGVPYTILYGNYREVLFHGYASDINFDSLLNVSTR